MKNPDRRIALGTPARITAAILTALIFALLLTPCAANAAADNESSDGNDLEWDIFVTLEPGAATPGTSPEATDNTAASPDTERASAAPSPEAEKKGNGRFFVTKFHIIFSCVISLSIAILIAVLQARKRFK